MNKNELKSIIKECIDEMGLDEAMPQGIKFTKGKSTKIQRQKDLDSKKGPKTKPSKIQRRSDLDEYSTKPIKPFKPKPIGKPTSGGFNPPKPSVPKVGEIKKPAGKPTRGKFPGWLDPTDNSGIHKATRSNFDKFKSRKKYNSKPPVTGNGYKKSMGVKKKSFGGTMVAIKRAFTSGK